MDNLDPRDEAHKEAAAPRKTPEQDAAATDREVPLTPPHTADAIHAWLDGENVTESAAARGGERVRVLAPRRSGDGEAPAG